MDEFKEVSHRDGSDLTISKKNKKTKHPTLRCFTLFSFDFACFGNCLCSGDRLEREMVLEVILVLSDAEA